MQNGAALRRIARESIGPYFPSRPIIDVIDYRVRSSFPFGGSASHRADNDGNGRHCARKQERRNGFGALALRAVPARITPALPLALQLNMFITRQP